MLRLADSIVPYYLVHLSLQLPDVATSVPVESAVIIITTLMGGGKSPWNTVMPLKTSCEAFDKSIPIQQSARAYRTVPCGTDVGLARVYRHPRQNNTEVRYCCSFWSAPDT